MQVNAAGNGQHVKTIRDELLLQGMYAPEPRMPDVLRLLRLRQVLARVAFQLFFADLHGGLETRVYGNFWHYIKRAKYF